MNGESTRWKPGQSGNPNGRPHDPLALELRKRWDQPGRTKALIDALEAAINAGDIERLKLAWERAYGKLATPTEISGGLTHRVIVEADADALPG